MKKKASTLSILAAIFAALTCTGLIGLVLAIIDLVKKDDSENHGGSIFAIIWFALTTVVGFGIIMALPSSSTNTTTTTSSVTESSSSSESSETASNSSIPTYHVGDTIHISDKNGDYELKITKVYETDYRNQFEEEQPQRVIMIDYEYKNISYAGEVGDYNTELFISSLNFSMYDKDGNAISSYPADTKGAVSISPGHQTTAQMAYGLNNPVNYIEAEFGNNPFLGTDCKIELMW